MSLMSLFAFIFLGASLISLWIRRDPKIYGTLLGLSMLSGLIAGNVLWMGLVFAVGLLLVWIVYNRKPNHALFILLVCISIGFQLGLLPGFPPFFFTPKFAIGLEGPLAGLFPLAFLVPLARTRQDWKSAIKGLLFGCAGIALMAIPAILGGVTHWQPKLPSFPAERILDNLILVAIPQEGLFRGFIQNTLCKTFKKIKWGKITALLLTSILFTAVHIFWSPNLEVLAFVFLASLLYGGVYLISGKIESAILCHFLLNFIHMTFFSYHAM